MSELPRQRMIHLHPREARKRWASGEKAARRKDDEIAAKKLKHIVTMAAIAKNHNMPMDELLGLISAGPSE